MGAWIGQVLATARCTADRFRQRIHASARRIDLAFADGSAAQAAPDRILLGRPSRNGTSGTAQVFAQAYCARSDHLPAPPDPFHPPAPGMLLSGPAAVLRRAARARADRLAILSLDRDPPEKLRAQLAAATGLPCDRVPVLGLEDPIPENARPVLGLGPGALTALKQDPASWHDRLKALQAAFPDLPCLGPENRKTTLPRLVARLARNAARVGPEAEPDAGGPEVA
ncbi:hypothetical protein [Rhodovulum adriaticum]|uniref:Uncharacterized protein n=1 Tax=Rhodovulum adriaticum TaxID=35804 RepID=A0A4R2NVD6_RHOAD|nr:hypothetical protein [Rhodovulum adriaticum]MBK1634342.1 hypothetical protein [Rhodovulum adriaticum]TCP26053.1 hypothetical protein EV656_10214 [Rhodovulum adriaticum]